MNTLEEEVDKLFEKFNTDLLIKSDQLKERIKKAALKSEKNVLRQYIASQKETKVQRESNQKKSMSVPVNDGRRMAQKMPAGALGAYKTRPSSRREQVYECESASDSE